jgi:hypothetical protein
MRRPRFVDDRHAGGARASQADDGSFRGSSSAMKGSGSGAGRIRSAHAASVSAAAGAQAGDGHFAETVSGIQNSLNSAGSRSSLPPATAPPTARR